VGRRARGRERRRGNVGHGEQISGQGQSPRGAQAPPRAPRCGDA
jgi:hypothetical protein